MEDNILHGVIPKEPQAEHESLKGVVTKVQHLTGILSTGAGIITDVLIATDQDIHNLFKDF